MQTKPLVAALGIALTAQLVSGQVSETNTNAASLPISQHDEPVRNTKEWNLKKGLAIKGYDPVAYFPEGGGKAVKGDEALAHSHQGATYHFANRDNLDRFKNNPARYEPAHGGWCSWAMRDEDKTDIDPKNFIVKKNRLFLFYSGFWGNTKKQWEKGDHKTYEKEADSGWKEVSGEEPRTGGDDDGNQGSHTP